MSQLATTADPLRPLLEKARSVFGEMCTIEQSILRDRDRILVAGWIMGSVLAELKEKVGHGCWLYWLGGHLPDIGETRARRCIALFDANRGLATNQANLPDLTFEDFDSNSARAFFGGYQVEKDRPQLEGDKKLAPQASFDAGTNRFAALFHRIKEGHAQAPPLEVVAPQVKTIVEGLREIYGRGPVDELLG